MKSKYVNEANVKSSHAANTITMWLGIIGFIFFGFMLMAVLLYGDEDIFMISIIVLALIILSIVLVIMAMLSLTFGSLAGMFCAKASAGFARNLRKDIAREVIRFADNEIEEQKLNPKYQRRLIKQKNNE